MGVLRAPIESSHPWYRDLLAIPNGEDAELCAFIEDLFQRTHEFLDSRLGADLHRDFPQRLWEMCTAGLLLDSGHELTPAKKRPARDSGPDLLLADGNTWVEAIAVERGTGPDRIEWPDYSQPGALSIPDEAVQLRILAGLEVKRAKGESYRRKGQISEGDRYVISLSAAMVPSAGKEGVIPRILQALFAIGRPTVTVAIPTGEIIGTGFEHRPQVPKAEGAAVEAGFFLSDASSHVSGVIYSTALLWNLPNQLLTSYRLVHNPRAHAPLPSGWLTAGREHVVENDIVVERDHRTSTPNKPLQQTKPRDML
jgi:hypothetical protein